MKKLAPCPLVALVVFLAPFAYAFNFPVLTGRVVDDAGIMTAQSRSDVEAKSKEFEDKSGIQLVVATVKSLQGSDIESYANQLFRFWKIGEAKKNNGVLLLVAPVEHKVRIEVGYGLEGILTDAASSVIISSVIVPRFKAADYSGGIVAGVDSIISILSTDPTDWHRKVHARSDSSSDFDKLFPVLFFLLIFFIVWYLIGHAGGPPSGRGGRGVGPVFVPWGGSWGGGGGGFSGGGGFGGFSGGGGSSGGGGASGSW